MLDFIKKYPMSILLGIIALNLFSIAGSLKTEAKINKQKLVCLQYKRNHINAVELVEKLKLKQGTNRLDNICDPILKSLTTIITNLFKFF